MNTDYQTVQPRGDRFTNPAPLRRIRSPEGRACRQEIVRRWRAYTQFRDLRGGCAPSEYEPRCEALHSAWWRLSNAYEAWINEGGDCPPH